MADAHDVPIPGRILPKSAVAAVVVAIGLVAPIGASPGAIRAVLAVAGIGIAVLSLGALFVSESSSLFGFTENGYRMAIVVAIASEVAAVLFLVIYLVASPISSRWRR